jgi:hypothetical protein
MIGDTITLPLLSGNVVCNKINQDGYSSEYLYATSLLEYRIRVRHTKTGPKAEFGALSYDRHQFDVTKTTYAVGATPASYLKYYFVQECLPGTTSVDLQDGVADYQIASSNAILTKLLGWES